MGKKYFFKVLCSVLTVFGFCKGYTQLYNKGLLYIDDGAFVHLSTGIYGFGKTSEQSLTTRTATVHGKLSFGSLSTCSGISDSHYIDGYVSSVASPASLFPIGQSGVYAPILAESSGGVVEAAYYREDPSVIGKSLGTELSEISTIEYWDVKGVDASVSLTWRASSNVAAMTEAVLSNITIVGFDGAQWKEIPSKVDPVSVLGGDSDLSAGSITSKGEVNLKVYKAFSLGAKTTLKTPELDISDIFISIVNRTFSASASLGIRTIEVYDITGRKVESYKINGATDFVKPFDHAKGIYIARIKLNNDATVTKKVVTLTH